MNPSCLASKDPTGLTTLRPGRGGCRCGVRLNSMLQPSEASKYLYGVGRAALSIRKLAGIGGSGVGHELLSWAAAGCREPCRYLGGMPTSAHKNSAIFKALCYSASARDRPSPWQIRTADILLARAEDGTLLGAATLVRLPKPPSSPSSTATGVGQSLNNPNQTLLKSYVRLSCKNRNDWSGACDGLEPQRRLQVKARFGGF